MRLAQISELAAAIESLGPPPAAWLDFQVLSYSHLNDGMLTIAASRDFCYYHNLEIRLTGVSYFSGVLAWTAGEEPAGVVTADLATAKGDQFAIRFSNDEGLDILVFAEQATINADTVYYYERHPLGEHERIADWVRQG